MELEVRAVTDKHLLVARNITTALSRYVADTKSVFKLVAENIIAGRPIEGARQLLDSLHFKHVCITNETGQVNKFISVNPKVNPTLVPEHVMQYFQGKLDSDEVIYSDIMPDDRNDPTIYIAKSIADNQIAIGALDTDYFIKLQEKIAFGEQGHAAIVDKRGRVIAHPNKEWRKDMKDISKVDPVSQMMEGKTGVSHFFSPAVKTDMVAGYTTVPKVGWGVMVPQPLAELEAQANRVKIVALQIVAVGIIVAIVLSWLVAGYLAKPVQAVAEAARALMDEKLETRIAKLPRFIPSELRSLATTFNNMISRIEEQVAVRTEQLSTANVLLKKEVEERKQADMFIEHLAYHDSLTGLPNRRLMLNRLQEAIDNAKENQLLGALIFLDLDRFKTLNDALGHPVGDALLIEVALRLKQVCPSENVIARLGGDEFVILLDKLNTNAEEIRNSAQLIAQKILKKLSEPYFIQGYEHHITASIGVTLFSPHNATTADVLKCADTAMYRAKLAGKNTIRFFEHNMHADANKRLRLEKALRQAVQNNEFDLFYQPQVDITTGQIVGAATLVQWHRNNKDNVPPSTFIPIAEETGLIMDLGIFTLQETCKNIKLWTTEIPDLALRHATVNVSPRQFYHPDFEFQLEQILEENNVEPTYLGLELTEQILNFNVEETIKKMRRLRKLGIRFGLDDFGTGYSSLTYLQRLPLEYIKMDQSFVRDITRNPGNLSIVETIIVMAKNLEFEIVPEGVETEAEMNFLRNKGCRVLQGNYFSPAVESSVFKSLLDEQGVNFSALRSDHLSIN